MRERRDHKQPQQKPRLFVTGSEPLLGTLAGRVYGPNRTTEAQLRCKTALLNF